MLSAIASVARMISNLLAAFILRSDFKDAIGFTRTRNHARRVKKINWIDLAEISKIKRSISVASNQTTIVFGNVLLGYDGFIFWNCCFLANIIVLYAAFSGSC